MHPIIPTTSAPKIRSIESLSFDCLGKILSYLATLSDVQHFPLTTKKFYLVFRSERQLHQIQSFSARFIGDRALSSLARFKMLKSLDISNCPDITDEGFSHLKDLPLESLDCSFPIKKVLQSVQLPNCRLSLQNERFTKYKIVSNLTNLALFYLKDMPLRSLDLTWGCNFTDLGFSFLKKMPLEELNIAYCSKITNEGLKSFQAMSLRILDLSFCYLITDEALSVFKGMALEMVSLAGCRISDRGVANFKARSLIYFNVSCCHLISDQVCLLLKDMTLQTLDLSFCPKITDVGVEDLSSFPLQELNLSGCIGITDRSVHSLGKRNWHYLNLTKCCGLTIFYQKIWREEVMELQSRQVSIWDMLKNFF